MTKIIFYIILYSLTLVPMNILNAQNGSAGAQELLLPVGARSLAMSDAFISGIGGIEATYYNPAGLSKNTSALDGMFTFLSYIADINMSYLAVASNLGKFGTIGLSIKSLDFGEIPITTIERPYGTGETFSPTFFVAGISYSNHISENLRIGISTKIIFEKIIETSTSGVSFDFGFQYEKIAGIDGLSVGAVLKNLGPNLSFDGNDLLKIISDSTVLNGNKILKVETESFDLPLQFEIGSSYQSYFLAKYNFIITSSYLFNSFSEDELRFAAEFNYDYLFFVRGGYILTTNISENARKIFGPTIGFGINIHTLFNIVLDYAYRFTRYFNANQIITLKLSF